MMTLLLAGRLIDGTSKLVKENQVIFIKDGIIERVADATAEMKEMRCTDEIQWIDASNLTVIPGLINGHCHLCFSASDRPAEDIFSDDKELLLMRSQQHCLEALAVGVTTVRDCGSSNRTVIQLKNAIDKGIVRGSRVISCGRAITSTGGHCWFLGGEADGVSGMQHRVREVLKDGADFVKVMVSGGNMTPGSGPGITQFGLEEMRVAASEAHMHGKHLSVHVHSTTSIRDAFLAGADVFDHCSWKKGNGIDYEEDLVALMVEKGVRVCPALGAPYRMDVSLWFANQPERIEFWKVFREQRFELTRRMIQAGMRIIGGDDAGCRMTKFYDYWKGLKLMEDALGLSPMEILQCTTSEVADVMGVGDRIGAIKAGMDADLVVVDGKPDEDLNCLKTPKLVIQRGKVVAKDGAILPV